MGSSLSCLGRQSSSQGKSKHKCHASKRPAKRGRHSPNCFKLQASATSGVKPQQWQQKRPCPQYGADGYVVVGQLVAQEGSLMRLMRNKKTKELVAGKWVPRVKGKGLEKGVEREIINHRKLMHSNIIGFKEVYLTAGHLVIVTEYASGGPLQERIQASGRCSEEQAKKLFTQLVDGLAYCHAQDISHRNLRMDNLLLEGGATDPKLKISNFGYSKSAVLDSAMHSLLSAPAYSSPELLYGVCRGYEGAPVDVWAAGVILFCLLTGQMPFLDPAEPQGISRTTMQRISKGQFQMPSNVQISPACLNLLHKVFTPDPKLRIKAADMKRHPWLSGIVVPEQSTTEAGEPAEQTEDDIIAVVQRARARRDQWRANERRPQAAQNS